VLSQAEYRIIVEHAPLLIWRSNTTGKCDYFNERWLAFTGRALQDEVGDGWAAGVHADDLDRCVRTYMDAFRRREPFEMEYRLRRYDGEYRWVLDTGGPIHDDAGQFAGFVGTCVDVTDRVEARASLARATLKGLGLSS
jgi:PAS domain S-box-containing protein